MNWRAVKSCAFLSLLFLTVYGGCNWITSLRNDVRTFYFEWERHIPFVPLMIIPYMSIDLFFVAAPFLCRDDRQRRTLSNRITAAILIAGVCFLAFPLRFAFDRPQVSGWLGVVFNNFRNLDQPFNQLPSLHIALRTILAVFYVSRTRGFLRLLVRVWFSLIGLSTLLTYQHHIIDVIGGFALALLCIHLWQDQSLRLPTTSNRRVGGYYIAGATALSCAAILARPVGLLLLWPALSMFLISSAYFGVGPGIFRKQNGKLPATTTLLFWPILLGQWLSLRYYARQCAAWNVLTDRIWIGRQLNDIEARHAVEQGVRAVLDLTGEFSEPPSFRSLPNYFSLPIMDLTAPTTAQLAAAIAFLGERSTEGITYVHCKAGYSRTAAVAGAFLLASGQAKTVEQAIGALQSARPAIVVRPEIRRALHTYQLRLNDNPTRLPAQTVSTVG